MCFLALSVINVNAQNKADSEAEYSLNHVSITTSFKDENIEYKFKSLEELNDEIVGIIEDLDLDKSRSINDACEIAIALKLEMFFGAATVEIKEKVISNCKDKTSKAVVETLKRVIAATVNKEIAKAGG